MVQYLGPRHALRRGLDDLQLLYHGIPDALHLGQPVRGGGDDAVEVAETVQQASGEGFYVLPGDGAEEDQFQQFILRHRRGTAFHEAGAQALAVVADIGGKATFGEGCAAVFVPVEIEEGGGFVKGASRAHAGRVPGDGEGRVNGFRAKTRKTGSRR